MTVIIYCDSGFGFRVETLAEWSDPENFAWYYQTQVRFSRNESVRIFY